MANIERAQKSKRLPLVFTSEEVKRVLAKLDGTHWLIAGLLHGSGVRLKSCKEVTTEVAGDQINYGRSRLFPKSWRGFDPDSFFDPKASFLIHNRFRLGRRGQTTSRATGHSVTRGEKIDFVFGDR